jgi:hypothetical protein
MYADVPDGPLAPYLQNGCVSRRLDERDYELSIRLANEYILWANPSIICPSSTSACTCEEEYRARFLVAEGWTPS